MDSFIKENVDMHEYIMHKTIYELDICNIPKIYAYDEHHKRMMMQKIDGMSVSDFYNENDTDTPDNIYDDIRKIIKKLNDINIVYIDITGYNFIIDKDKKLWIIDFEHVYIKKTGEQTNSFVHKFINNCNGWNPYFK